MHIPEIVTITEVAPRDGLQSFHRPIATGIKVRMLESLIEAGFRSVEVTSFARPDVVPFLADAEEVIRRLGPVPGVDLRALVPNVRGALRAIDAGVDTLVVLLTVTESYSQKNQNRSVQELIKMALEVLDLGRREGKSVDMAVGMAFFDPYEGDTPPERVEWVFEELIAGGAKRLYVATSVGMANPAQVNRLCSRLLERWPGIELGIHLHNTNGMALANALAAMDAGVRRLEGSICGIGGGIVMPHGIPSVGNVPTEDLVHMLTEMGINCGVAFDAVLKCAEEVSRLLEIVPDSFALRGGTKKQVRRQAEVAPRDHPV